MVLPKGGRELIFPGNGASGYTSTGAPRTKATTSDLRSASRYTATNGKAGGKLPAGNLAIRYGVIGNSRSLCAASAGMSSQVR